jgi:hypothetical protein
MALFCDIIPSQGNFRNTDTLTPFSKASFWQTPLNLRNEGYDVVEQLASPWSRDTPHTLNRLKLRHCLYFGNSPAKG